MNINNFTNGTTSSTITSSIRETGNDELDLQLIDGEIQASVTAIIAYVVLIQSAMQDKQIIYDRINGIERIDETSPVRLLALSNAIVLIAYILFADVAFKRYREIERSERLVDTPLTPIPNLNIAKGYLIIIIGSVVKLLGSFQRLQEENIPGSEENIAVE